MVVYFIYVVIFWFTLLGVLIHIILVWCVMPLLCNSLSKDWSR